MIEQTDLAGSFTLPGTSMTLNRTGHGAMQLGPRWHYNLEGMMHS